MLAEKLAFSPEKAPNRFASSVALHMAHRTFFAILLAVIGTLLLTEKALAVPIEARFSWEGDAGYQADIWFTYDDSFATVSAQAYSVAGISQMSYSFNNPQGEMLVNRTAIQNGAGNYPYMKFTFDTGTFDFVPDSRFDVGREHGPGYLGMRIGTSSSGLFSVVSSNGPRNFAFYDSGGSYTFSKVPVPDGGSSLLLLLLAIPSIVAARFGIGWARRS